MNSRPSTAAAETSAVASGERRSSGRRIRSRARAGSTTPSCATRSGSNSAPRSPSRRSASRRKQRHALGAREQLGGEVARRGAFEHLLEQRGDLGARERREGELEAAILRAQQAERARHRVAGCARLVAHGDEQEQRRVDALVREVLEQAERLGARPLEILQHHEQRTAPRLVAQGAAHRVEEQEAALFGSPRRTGRRLGGAEPEQAGQLGLVRRHLTERGGCGRLLEQAPQHLREQPEGGHALALARVPDQGAGAEGLELRRRALGEARLADARRARDQHHGPLAPRDGARPGLVQACESLAPAHERALGGGIRSRRRRGGLAGDRTSPEKR